MQSANLDDIINQRILPAGRRIFAMRQIQQQLDSNDDLRKTIGNFIEHDKMVLDLRTGYRSSGGPRWPAKLRELNVEHDRLWSGIARAISGFTAGFKPGESHGAAAAKLAKEIFGKGVRSIIQLPFVEQSVNTEQLLGRLNNELAKEVKTLGIKPFVDRLADVNKQFSALLQQEHEKETSYEEFRKADRIGHLHMLQLIAIVVGRHPGTADNDDQEREKLLKPIIEQSRAVAEAQSHHKGDVILDHDVDPHTGVPVEPPAPAESTAPSEPTAPGEPTA